MSVRKHWSNISESQWNTVLFHCGCMFSNRTPTFITIFISVFLYNIQDVISWCYTHFTPTLEKKIISQSDFEHKHCVCTVESYFAHLCKIVISDQYCMCFYLYFRLVVLIYHVFVLAVWYQKSGRGYSWQRRLPNYLPILVCLYVLSVQVLVVVST